MVRKRKAAHFIGHPFGHSTIGHHHSQRLTIGKILGIGRYEWWCPIMRCLYKYKGMLITCQTTALKIFYLYT
jgi:hypothetical protein